MFSKITERDSCEWYLNEVDQCDKDVWRSGVKSAMCAASNLAGRGPSGMDDAPASAH